MQKIECCSTVNSMLGYNGHT